MKLPSFLARRTAELLLLVFAVTTATFVLASFIPGDFFTAFEANPNVRPERIAELRRQYGLADPYYVQYARWLGRSARLDFGYSLHYQRPVSAVVAEALPSTMAIGLPALLLGLGAGVLVGTLHAIFEGRPLGYALDALSSVLLSVPALVLGIASLLVAARTGWFPLGGTTSVDLAAPTFFESLPDRLHHLILPVLCLSVPAFAWIEKTQHSGAAGALREPFFRSARARGLARHRLFWNYVVRPSLNPVLALLGPMAAALLSGSLVLEQIFSWPGLGKATYDALFNRDIFLVLGCVASGSVLLAVGNLVADLLLYVIDPRTRQVVEEAGR